MATTLSLNFIRPVTAPQKVSRFKYTAIGANQLTTRGTIKAHTRESAQEQLLLRYRHLLSLEEVETLELGEKLAGYVDHSAALPAYTKSIAVMINAGLPLYKVFEVAAQGEDEYLNRVMNDICKSLFNGRSVSQAMAKWNNVFDQTYIGMVHAGEQSGHLHKNFAKLAELLERRRQVENKVKSAMAYPICVSVVALLILWVLVALVVPKLIPSFTSVGMELPWLTKMLVAAGTFSTSMPCMLVAGITAAAWASVAYRVMVKGEHLPVVAYYVDLARLHLPLFGELYRLSVLSKAMGTMAAALDSGSPLTTTLAMAGRVTGSPVYKNHFDNVLRAIKNGETLGQAMEATQAFPPVVLGMATLGEESGKVPFLMKKVAGLYEEDLERKLETLTALIEPLMLGGLGLVIGTIVLGTFLPMMNLIQGL